MPDSPYTRSQAAGSAPGRSGGVSVRTFGAGPEDLQGVRDVAEAVFFLASEAAAKSTGNILNVDAGNQI